MTVVAKGMATFQIETTINAPIERVWAALADIGSIHEWNPGVEDSRVTSHEPTGRGASRHCDLGGENYLEEQVVEWEEGARLTMRIVDTNLPFKRADIRFRLESRDHATAVAVSPDYELKYGPLGLVLDALFARRAYERGMRALLAGLKRRLEDDEEAYRSLGGVAALMRAWKAGCRRSHGGLLVGPVRWAAYPELWAAAGAW